MFLPSHSSSKLEVVRNNNNNLWVITNNNNNNNMDRIEDRCHNR